jgi:non-homologous end joining protein Ku
MARSKFTLAVGLLQVPIRLEKVSKEIGLNFKQIHTDNCGGTVGRKMYCKKCGKEVSGDAVGKGWAFSDKDETPLPFTKEEIVNLHPMDVAEATIAVTSFIEPLPYKWFNGNHYAVTPQDKNTLSSQSLKLFFSSLAETKKVALIKYWDSNTEYIGTINSNGILSHIFYSDEVEDEHALLENVEKANVDKGLLKMLTQYIKTVAQANPVNPVTDIKNVYRENVTARAIEKKEKGEFAPMVAPTAVAVDPAKDLMAVLSSMVTQAEGTLKGTEPIAKAKAKKAKKVA